MLKIAIIEQIIFIATNPQEIHVLYNSDQTVGRYQCRADAQDAGETYFWW